MPSSTDFWTCVSIFHKTINDKHQLEDLIEEKRNFKKYILDRIRTMVFMTEPKKFMSEDDATDPEWYLNKRCDELFDELEETIYELHRLEMLEACWDECHDKETGLAIDIPEEFEMKSFCSGDFVKSVKYPKGRDF